MTAEENVQMLKTILNAIASDSLSSTMKDLGYVCTKSTSKSIEWELPKVEKD